MGHSGGRHGHAHGKPACPALAAYAITIIGSASRHGQYHRHGNDGCIAHDGCYRLYFLNKSINYFI
jgi:hypothetical protein